MHYACKRKAQPKNEHCYNRAGQITNNEKEGKNMKAFKLIVGILVTFLLIAANVMAYEVVVHNYTNVPMEVTTVGENWKGGYDSGSCTVEVNKENNKCSLSPIGVCFQRVKWKWDAYNDKAKVIDIKAGTYDDHPNGSMPACYNVYYEIKYNYNKTGISFERKY
jgi:hypothetical protein